MKTMIVALAAILVICALCAPGSAQNKGPKQVTQDAQGNKQSSGKLRPITRQTTNENQNNGRPVTTGNDQQTVRITELPKVSIDSHKDAWDKALVFATGLLVLVGTFQIIYLWRTVQATNANAIAAQENAKALIASERAWIHADFTGREIMAGVTHYSLVITNQGKTPAQVFGYHVWHGLLTEGVPFAKEMLTTHFSEDSHVFIGGGQTTTLRDDFRLDDLFTLENLTPAASAGFPQGAFCVTVNYGDVVTPKAKRQEHHTSFAPTNLKCILETSPLQPEASGVRNRS